MTLVIDRAGITGAPRAPVSRWTARVSASGAALADVTRSGVSTEALLPGPLAIDLPGTVIDALDDAWNREAAVPASIHIELWVPLDSAPALGAAGPLEVAFGLSLVGTGRTTTHGWP
jgi:hypothetical protein